MVAKTRDHIEIQDTGVEAGEPIEPNGALPTPFAPPSTHPNPERERHLDALLERAWPKIKASMYYLRDR